MDPLDHLLELPDGLRCTVCDERVPATRIRALAHRDDLTFIEIDCEACASSTLGFVLAGRTDEPAPSRESSGANERGADEAADPVSADDVLDMHELLASWRGGLTDLLARDGRGRDDRRAEPGR
jgi:hypothetical protein